MFWELDPYDPVELIWMDEWGLGSVRMDMRNRTVEGLERVLQDVVERAGTTEFKQMTASAFQHGIALYNPLLLERWVHNSLLIQMRWHKR